MYEDLYKNYPSAVNEILSSWDKLPQPKVDINYLAEQCKDNELLEKLYQEMLEYFHLYTEIVCKYNIFLIKMKDQGGITRDDLEAEGVELDNERRVGHNTMIDSVNILARTMIKMGKDGDWIKNIENNRFSYRVLAMSTSFKQMMIEKNNIKIEG